MQQDELIGPCEICEKDRELSLTPSASGGYYALLCWECLGEVEGNAEPTEAPRSWLPAVAGG